MAVMHLEIVAARLACVGRRVCLGFALALLAGCESPEWTRSLNDSFAHQDKPSAKTEEQHRQEFQETKSHESMRWLLAHCIHTGMSYNEVCRIMGEDGNLETQDRQLKSGGGNYRIDDEMYGFGPDSKGKTVYLAFRENRLINFDPEQFR
jgi:hypothetical protein